MITVFYLIGKLFAVPAASYAASSSDMDQQTVARGSLFL